MKISDRFTDYGLIGGCFWALQFTLWGVVGASTLKSLLGGFKTLLNAVPPAAVPSFAAFLGALALIAVFTTGLMLDLFGSFSFRDLEVRIFVVHMRRNQQWLERVMDQNRDYIQEDWSTLLNPSPRQTTKQAFLLPLKLCFFWIPRYRQELTLLLFSKVQPYTRIQSFLLSYVLLSPGAEKIELLGTQMSLWSTSRAIASGMLLASVELLVLFGVRASFALRDVDVPNIPLTVGVIAACYVLMGIAAAVTYAASTRVCGTLFALAYVMNSKSREQISSAPAT